MEEESLEESYFGEESLEESGFVKDLGVRRQRGHDEGEGWRGVSIYCLLELNMLCDCGE
jgi:hypothetical protein